MQVPASIEGHWRLVDPEGNDTVQPREISIQGEPGHDIRTVVVVSITPCLFKKEGDHVMVLELGDQTFERPFGVRVVEELPKQGSSHGN